MKTPTPPPLNAYKTGRTVAFSDTDAAGVAHFTAIMRYIEDAEHQALTFMDIPVFDQKIGWPRVHMDCDFLAPLLFGERMDIILWLEDIGHSSLTWNFHIHHHLTGGVMATGQFITVKTTRKGEKKNLSPAEKKKLKQLQAPRNPKTRIKSQLDG